MILTIFIKEAIEKRLSMLWKLIPQSFFKGRSVLELGAAYGDIGAVFASIGADITVSDYDPISIEYMSKRYPPMKSCIIDVDNGLPELDVDCIIHWGLLHNIKNPEKSLRDACNHCSILLLECIVFDSSDPTDFWKCHDGCPILPAERIEQIIREQEFSFRRIDSPELVCNEMGHVMRHYDWVVNNSKVFDGTKYRFWICWKGGEDNNPILQNSNSI